MIFDVLRRSKEISAAAMKEGRSTCQTAGDPIPFKGRVSPGGLGEAVHARVAGWLSSEPPGPEGASTTRADSCGRSRRDDILLLGLHRQPSTGGVAPGALGAPSMRWDFSPIGNGRSCAWAALWLLPSVPLCDSPLDWVPAPDLSDFQTTAVDTSRGRVCNETASRPHSPARASGRFGGRRAYRPPQPLKASADLLRTD
jgi:hypothetical protein